MGTRSLADTFKHQGWRAQMVQALRDRGIHSTVVLDAMNTVPRHLFMDTVLDHRAYEDHAFPILCEQTISQPSTVAFQSELLETEPGMKVLEIGTGSGYQTAVLCAMQQKVFTIERHKPLFDATKLLLNQLGYKAMCFLGDGFAGLPGFAPFDRILITCGAPYIPERLLEQLKVGGIMVIPVGTGNEEMEMLRVEKTGDGQYRESRYGHCNFVPMLQKVEYGRRY